MNLKSTATSRAEVSHALAILPEIEPSKERAGAREVLLQQGKELAARTILAYERWARCPFNAQEAAQVRGLQKQFADWEHTVKVQCSDMDTAALFPDSRLRPYRREPGISDIARLRRTPSIPEAHMVSLIAARRAERPVARKEVDDSIWPSAGPGI